MLLLLASITCNLFGFRSLSQTLGMFAFLGFLGAAALYAVVRVLTLLLITLLRSSWARSVLETRVSTLETWGSRGLAFVTTLVWLRGMLQLFNVYEPMVDVVSRALQSPLGHGSVYFTIGGVLGVVLTMLIGYAIVNCFTLILNQLILPKFQLHRGVPYAVSKITYYGLLLLVAATALAEAGVELSKLTVLDRGPWRRPGILACKIS